MIPKIITTVIFLLLLFYNPLKVEGTKICSNIPYLDMCVGYTSNKTITMDDLGD